MEIPEEQVEDFNNIADEELSITVSNVTYRYPAIINRSIIKREDFSISLTKNELIADVFISIPENSYIPKRGDSLISEQTGEEFYIKERNEAIFSRIVQFLCIIKTKSKLDDNRKLN